MNKQMSKSQVVGVIGTFLALFLYGCAFSSLSLIIPTIAFDLSAELSALAPLYFLQFGGYCLAVAFLMFFSHRVSSGTALGSGVVAMAVGGAASWLAPSVGILRLTVLIFGLGMGFVNMSGLNLLNGVSSRYGSVMVNYSRAVVSVGSFLAPMTITALGRLGVSWRAFYLAVAVLALATLALAYPLISSTSGRRVVAGKSDVKGSVQDQGFWVLLACVVLYVGAEVAAWSWGASFMTARFGVSLSQAQPIVTLFFGVFVVGRFLLPPVFIKFGLKRALNVGLLLSLLLAAPTLFTANWSLFVKLYPLFGFVLAPIIPTLLALSSERYGRTAGFSLASLTLGIGVAAAVFPSVLGALTRWVPVNLSIPWTVVVMFGILNLTFWAWRPGQVSPGEGAAAE